MSRFSAAKTTTPPETTAEEILFKPDRPRQIDRFINFFGGLDAAPAADTPGNGFERTSSEEDDS